MISSEELPGVPPREVLEKMSYHELIQFEDALYYQNEIDQGWRIRSTGGRFIFTVLTGFLWLVFMLISMKIGESIDQNIRPLYSFASIIVTLLLAAIAGGLIWKLLGYRLRFLLRLALHYWPASLILIAMYFYFLRS